MSCFDNEYKLNREDEEFPKGGFTMPYSDNGFDEEEFDDDSFYLDDDFEDDDDEDDYEEIVGYPE